MIIDLPNIDNERCEWDEEYLQWVIGEELRWQIQMENELGLFRDDRNKEGW